MSEERPSPATALWLNATLGTIGVDRMASGDLVGGIIKFILAIILFPIAILWNLADLVTLQVAGRFFVGPPIRWKYLPMRERTAHRIGAGIVFLLLFAAAVTASILAGSAYWRDAWSSGTESSVSGASLEDEENMGMLSDVEREGLRNQMRADKLEAEVKREEKQQSKDEKSIEEEPEDLFEDFQSVTPSQLMQRPSKPKMKGQQPQRQQPPAQTPKDMFRPRKRRQTEVDLAMQAIQEGRIV